MNKACVCAPKGASSFMGTQEAQGLYFCGMSVDEHLNTINLKTSVSQLKLSDVIDVVLYSCQK